MRHCCHCEKTLVFYDEQENRNLNLVFMFADDMGTPITGLMNPEATSRLTFCDTKCAKGYLKEETKDILCGRCRKPFQPETLIPDCNDLYCGGCQQDRNHEYACFLDATGRSPRKEAYNQFLAAMFLKAHGWTVQVPPDPKHLTKWFKKLDNWLKAGSRPLWTKLGAEHIDGTGAMKSIEKHRKPVD